MTDGEFSVWLWFPDDWHFRELDHVDAQTAIECAAKHVHSPATTLDVLQKVMVTDGDDNTVFLWERAKGKGAAGIVWPLRNAETGRFGDG